MEYLFGCDPPVGQIIFLHFFSWSYKSRWSYVKFFRQRQEVAQVSEEYMGANQDPELHSKGGVKYVGQNLIQFFLSRMSGSSQSLLFIPT